jgi:L-amino acid N-acyltransferase YncA
MLIKECSEEDICLLTKMNQQLIEDEKAETDLSFEQLKERMLRFISSEYKAFLFYIEDRVVGYALCNDMANKVFLHYLTIENKKSITLAEKLGFKINGKCKYTFREKDYLHHIYSLDCR